MQDMPSPAGLKRVIGRWDLVGILINATIGAGILGLPGRAYALVGPYSIVACLLGGVLIALVGVCYAEAGSRFTRSGGSYLYIHAAFGPAAGFVAGWTQMITRVLSFAAIANLAIVYAAGLWPPIAAEWGRLLAITLLAGGLGGLVYAGVQQSKLASNVFSGLKLAVLIGFVGMALPAMVRLHVPQPPVPAAKDWSSAIILLLFALIGLDGAVINGGEMRDPRRHLPPAIAIGVSTVVAFYVLVILASMAVVPDLAHSTRPIFDGTVAVLGPAGAAFFTVGAILTMTGTLFSLLFGSPRVLLAMAENGQLPKALAAIHPRTRAPHRAVIVSTMLTWGVAVASTFLGALAATTMTRLLLYAAVAASVLVLRWREVSETPRPLNLRGGMAIAVVTIGGCLWAISRAASADLAGFGVALALALLFLLAGRMMKTSRVGCKAAYPTD